MVKERLERISVLFSYGAIGSLLFFAIGLKEMDNYIHWGQFSLVLLCSGLLFRMILYFILCYFIPGAITYKNARGVGLLAPLVCSFSFISFGVGTLLNESFSQDKECKTYTIQKMGEGFRAHYIFIDNGRRVERLSFGKAFNKQHNAGDKINLCVITGGLGFKYYKINSSV